MKIVSQIKLMLRQLAGMLPSQVPQGLTEFESWVQDIRELYSPPGNDRSIRFVLSSLLMRLNPDEAYKSKFFFARSLKRAAASQVAVHVQEEIKNEQRKEAEEAKKLAEATALDSGDDSQIQN